AAALEQRVDKLAAAELGDLVDFLGRLAVLLFHAGGQQPVGLELLQRRIDGAEAGLDEVRILALNHELADLVAGGFPVKEDRQTNRADVHEKRIGHMLRKNMPGLYTHRKVATSAQCACKPCAVNGEFRPPRALSA